MKRPQYGKLAPPALVVAGAALLLYGLFFHTAAITSAPEPGPSTFVEGFSDPIPMVAERVTSVEREPALIREVAVGGLRRDESGRIEKTYTGSPPSACPT